MSSANPTLNYNRANALLAVLQHSEDAELIGILRRHPDYPQLLEVMKSGVVPSVYDLLLAELHQMERDLLANRDADALAELCGADFWIRRQRLTQFLLSRTRLVQLPRLWQVIATLSAAEIRVLTEKVGIEATASLARHLPQDVINTLLTALGEQLEMAVSARIAINTGVKISRPVAKFFLEAYTGLAQKEKGSRLARRLGCLVAGICYRALDERRRHLLGMCATTNLAEVLSSAGAPDGAEPQVIEVCELILRQCTREYVSSRNQIWEN